MATVPRPPIVYVWRQLSRHAALGTHDTNSFQLPQQQRLPPGKTLGWPNPVIAKTNPPQDWQNSFALSQQQRLPPGKSSFDLPVLAKRNPQDWQDTFDLPQQQRLPPGKTLGWPNPSLSAPSIRADCQEAFSPLAPLLQAPTSQLDWPNPRGPQAIRPDCQESFLPFPLPLQQDLPPGKASYDSPVLARRNPQDWVVSSPIVLLTGAVAAAAPLRPVDWPVPRSQSRNLADWTSYLLPWSQAPPIRQNDWPNILLAPARTIALGYSDSFKLPLQQVIQPNQYDWPNPRAPKPLVVDWTNFALPALQPAGQRPFGQTDWPVPKTKVGVLQTWSDSFKLPLQQTLPPRQLDWPNPRGSVSYDLRGFTQRSVIVAPAPAKPINQYDWPNPRGPLQPIITARDFIHGVVPPVPPVFDSTRTLKNEVIRLRYLTNASSRVRFLKNEVRS